MERRQRRTHLPQRHSELPASYRALFKTMHEAEFGRIKNLAFVDGEPVLEPAPVVEEDYRFGNRSGGLTETAQTEFALKDAQVDFIRKLQEKGSGTVLNLEFKGGLPLNMTIERPA